MFNLALNMLSQKKSVDDVACCRFAGHNDDIMHALAQATIDSQSKLINVSILGFNFFIISNCNSWKHERTGLYYMSNVRFSSSIQLDLQMLQDISYNIFELNYPIDKVTN